MNYKVPGTTIGVIGGGQLARMIGEAASELGIKIVVLDPTSDCPGYPPAKNQVVGDFDDRDAYFELAENVDVLTYEIELADPDILHDITRDMNISVHPNPKTLKIIQDKFIEKQTLSEADIPVPDFRQVENVDELEKSFDVLGSPIMLKARKGGYDGRGNAVVSSIEEAREKFGSLDGLIAEKLIDFSSELSVIGVKGKNEIKTFPVGENIHKEEILRETVVPAGTKDSVIQKAKDVVSNILNILEGRGVYGVELFETQNRDILVNEIAPRPHNSGHYTIEGCISSQFEQHVRAVTAIPLGSTELRDPTVMANILGDVETPKPAILQNTNEIFNESDIKLHWYGKKEVRPLRKMGHITITGENKDHILKKIRRVKKNLNFKK